MAEFLKVEYAGQIATEPSMQYTKSGKAVTNFNVAYNNRWGGTDEVTWLRCTIWGDKAEAVNSMCQKGTKIFFEARLNPDENTGGPRVWYSTDTDEPRASYEVTVYNIVFLANMRPKRDDPSFPVDADALTPEELATIQARMELD